MFYLKYFEQYSMRKNEVYYICNNYDKRVSYSTGLYPRVEVNHDLHEIMFYQIRERERDLRINDILFKLTEETLMNMYEGYEINIIRTEGNMTYYAWKENNK